MTRLTRSGHDGKAYSMTSSAVSNTLLSPYRPIRSVEIQPSLLLPVGGKYHFAFCPAGRACPPWEIN
jgi:hypothetical protein